MTAPVQATRAIESTRRHMCESMEMQGPAQRSQNGR